MKHSLEQKTPECRLCGTTLRHTMVDLGMSPLCETFVRKSDSKHADIFYPLEVMVCEECFLVQAMEYSSNDAIFNDDYGYYSSFSSSWLKHAKKYTDMAISRFGLSTESFVVEVASNDGYLLKNFVEKKIPCLGIDPSANVAEAARSVGVETRVAFFTQSLAEDMAAAGQKADLIIGNNVLAHTPYLTDFVAAVKELLKPEGNATFEFPHLLNLIEQVQFDTIYHEHFSYFSLYTVDRLFREAGLRIVDVEEIRPAGGSLRIFLKHDAEGMEVAEAVGNLIAREKAFGLQSLETYLSFSEKVSSTRDALLTFLINARREGKSVVGYGAPGKGNTLLNYCGVKPDLLSFTVDMNHHKHDRLLPGTRIPIYPVDKINEVKPDYVLILPWNLAREITTQMAQVTSWGGKFVVPIPTLTILE